MASYSSQRTDLTGLLQEALCLYQGHVRHVSACVRGVIADLRDVEALLLEHYGFALRDRDVLDIGAGQFLPQMHYLARHNRVVGIDLDVIAQGINPLPYARMLFVNGPRRTAKTIARKLLGIDRRYRSELKAQLDLETLPRLGVLQMDACDLAFEDASFDFVHSFSVFHSLPNPAAAIDGIVRVLRQGGAAYISLHLYTSESGCLDPRAFVEGRKEATLWPHLRSRRTDQTRPNAYVNKLRLSQWRDLFTERMSGAKVLLTRTGRPDAESDATALLAEKELQGYSLEELLTHRVQVLWRKP